jgi:hypothetical protein
MLKNSVNDLCMIYASVSPSMIISKIHSFWRGSLEPVNQYSHFRDVYAS